MGAEEVAETVDRATATAWGNPVGGRGPGDEGIGDAFEEFSVDRATSGAGFMAATGGEEEVVSLTEAEVNEHGDEFARLVHMAGEEYDDVLPEAEAVQADEAGGDAAKDFDADRGIEAVDIAGGEVRLGSGVREA